MTNDQISSSKFQFPRKFQIGKFKSHETTDNGDGTDNEELLLFICGIRVIRGHWFFGFGFWDLGFGIWSLRPSTAGIRRLDFGFAADRASPASSF